MNVDNSAAITVHVVFSNNSNATAPHTTGADKKNENFAASSLFTPKSLPAAIVVPLRENPGISANTWLHPIMIASFNVIVFKFLSLLLLASANHSENIYLPSPGLVKTSVKSAELAKIPSPYLPTQRTTGKLLGVSDCNTSSFGVPSSFNP